jgi:hypothetical protein
MRHSYYTSFPPLMNSPCGLLLCPSPSLTWRKKVCFLWVGHQWDLALKVPVCEDWSHPVMKLQERLRAVALR